jgi:hypothetical protein
VNRRVFLVASMAVVACLSGCGSRQQPPTDPRLEADLSSRRTLSKAELEADMANRNNLHDVMLTNEGGGRFKGTGKAADGKLIELEATQGERRRSWKTRWKGSDGEASGAGSFSW